MADNKLSRRSFLTRSLIAAGAAATGAVAVLPELLYAEGPCAISTDDVEGPFYLNNAPLRTVLAAQDEPGQRLILRGRTLGNDCTLPVGGVTIDLWAANHEGCYSGFDGCAPERGNMNLRGRTITGGDGAYEFETIFPGKYLNGSQFRPAHLHLRVSTPGLTQALVTQLYFEGDTHIAIDPWASEADASERILPTTSVEGMVHASWDIILPVQGTAGRSTDSIGSSKILDAYPNPVSNSTRIPYQVAQAGLATLVITDLQGRTVKTLVSSVHSPGGFVEEWDRTDTAGKHVPAGAYICTMSSLESTRSIKLIVR